MISGQDAYGRKHIACNRILCNNALFMGYIYVCMDMFSVIWDTLFRVQQKLNLKTMPQQTWTFTSRPSHSKTQDALSKCPSSSLGAIMGVYIKHKLLMCMLAHDTAIADFFLATHEHYAPRTLDARPMCHSSPPGEMPWQTWFFWSLTSITPQEHWMRAPCAIHRHLAL